MKKNLFFKLGLFCAALVLVATCFITSAWAKYTKTVSATDTARVAKFEVTVVDKDNTKIESENAEINIFGTQLSNIKKDENGDNIATEKLIAPGSEGSFLIKITNSSEVSIRYTLTCELENTSNVPLVFCLSQDGDYKSVTEIFADLTGKMDVNTDNSETTYTIYWKWNPNSTNVDDTKLGEAAAKGNVVVKATIKLVVEQLLPSEN